MSKLSDFLSPQGGSGANSIFQLKASSIGVNQGDLVAISSDGYGYTVQTTDYGSVPAVGQIIAQTTVGSGCFPVSAQALPSPIIRNSDGTFIVAAPNASSIGLSLYKYSVSGSLLASASLETAGGASNVQLLQLSNGNVAVTYQISSVNKTTFAIFTTALVQVVAKTLIDGGTNAPEMAACALTGGGFALVYSPNTAGLRIAVYSNTGAAVKAPTTIVAATTNYFPNIVALSNGGFAVVYFQGTAGTYYAVYDASGNQVTAPTQLAGSGGGFPPRISAINGFFATVEQNGVGVYYTRVFSNAGVQQGTPFSSGYPALAIVNDGIQFWLGSLNVSNPWVFTLTSIPATGGANAVSNAITITSPPGNAGSAFAMTYDPATGSVFCILGSTGAQACSAWVVKLSAPGALIYGPSTVGAAAAATGSAYPNIVPASDFSFIAFYDFQSAAGAVFYIGKYAPASIVGVAQNSASAGALINVQQGIGTYPVNTLLGTITKTFDHTAQTINGNKGVLLPNGVVLKGM
jgi:hypothetical protein